MCVAVPGKVIKIKDQTANVDVLGNTCDVNVRLVDVKPGDYVLIHAGCAIEVLEKDTAEEILDLYQELEDEVNHDFRSNDRKACSV